MTLNEGRIGDVFIIINMRLETKVKKRLQDMGLTKGTKVKILSYYSKNAYVLNIRGSRIVIGKDIVKDIEVEPSFCNRCNQKRHRRRGRHMGHGIHESHKGKCV